MRNQPKISSENIDDLLSVEYQSFQKKIIVLDDDPTGTQTVHDVPVYTSWSVENIEEIFKSDDKLCFILTNSRSFSQKKTEDAHREIAESLLASSQKYNRDFILISRGDSTLRGHYPLETSVLADSLREQQNICGEVICPVFFEGGRITTDDIHYLIVDDQPIPVGETEFAKDKTFGFSSSNLKEYVYEKSNGKTLVSQCLSIENADLKTGNIENVKRVLEGSEASNKIIVNATNYYELKVFALALFQVMNNGRCFLFRSAASLPKILGNIADKEYLKKEEAIDINNRNGGLIIVGSHVNISTQQLARLKESNLNLYFEEFDINCKDSNDSYDQEIQRIIANVNREIKSGITAVIYTSRKIIDTGNMDKEAILKLSVNISTALIQVVKTLSVQPKYIIAKGGITSSDIATKGLGIKYAKVLGQIDAGIPVWLTDEKSKFTGLPYIIFPGNVGTKETLYKIVSKLEEGEECEK